jgi:hypothetical protein
MLTQIMKTQYDKTVKDTLGIDIREWKQYDDIESETYRRISVVMTSKMLDRLQSSAKSITQTASEWVKRTTMFSIADFQTESAADAMLNNYLNNHKLTVATTEAQWLVETSRNVAVVQVIDPLRNSVNQIADLIDAGDYNAARRLSKQIMALTKLPLSDGEGELISYVNDNREGLATPEVQGEIVSGLRRRAEELGKEQRSWLTIGDGKVREAHAQANGQIRPTGEPFDVGGYKMQYPGDASLGAPLSLIINCRCCSNYGED